jgi:ankyrin repeat protein
MILCRGAHLKLTDKERIKMKKLDIKNIIKYMAIGGCLFSFKDLCASAAEIIHRGVYVNVDAALTRDKRIIRDGIHEQLFRDLRDANGRVPIHSAAEQGKIYAVRILHRNGTDLDVTDLYQWTPLHVAASLDSSAAVRELLILGANPSARNNMGLTPLMLSASLGKLKASRALLAHGVPVDSVDPRGSSALDLAVEGYVRQFGSLREIKGKYPDLGGRWLCEEMCKLDNLPTIIRLLLDHGAGMVGGFRYLSRSLDLAIKFDSREVFEILLEYVLDINAKDLDGVTPLYLAVCHGNMEVVKLLLSRGADIDFEDQNGVKLPDIAERFGHIELEDYLVSAIAGGGGSTGDGVFRVTDEAH